MPAEPPTGELSADGKTKTFKVTATVIGAATEIPAIAFSYFDPAKQTYQTIHSDPIALSVKGGSVVGANDVVGVAPKPGAPRRASRPMTKPRCSSVRTSRSVGAGRHRQRAVERRGAVADRRPALRGAARRCSSLRSWQHRTRDQREDAAEVKAARKRVEAELARAAKDPARDTAGALTAALRGARSDARARSRRRRPTRAARDRELRAGREGRAAVRPSCASAHASWRIAGRARPSGEAERSKGVRARRAPARGRNDPRICRYRLCRDEYPAAGRNRLCIGIDHAIVGPWRRHARSRARGLSARARRHRCVRAHGGVHARRDRARRGRTRDAGPARAARRLGQRRTRGRRCRHCHPRLSPRTRPRRGQRARAQNLDWLRNRESPTLRPAGGGAADTLFFFRDWSRSRRLVVGACAFARARCCCSCRGQVAGAAGSACSRSSRSIVWLAMVRRCCSRIATPTTRS